MKLYSTVGATSVDHEGVEYKADKDGAVEVPDELGLFLHNLHVAGVRAWENERERVNRIEEEDHARKSDPAYLASIVESLAAKVDAQPKAVVEDADEVPAKTTKVGKTTK
jgi:hypothetical protein